MSKTQKTHILDINFAKTKRSNFQSGPSHPPVTAQLPDVVMAQPGLEVRKKTWRKPGLHAGQSRVTSLELITRLLICRTVHQWSHPTSTGRNLERGHADRLETGLKTMSGETAGLTGESDKVGVSGVG